MRLTLGSGSPQRLALLALLGVRPARVLALDVDETPLKGELPRKYCMRITAAKLAAAPCAAGEVVLCADTTVARGRRILGKPVDQAQARACLCLLSGHRHRVLTSVGVKSASGSVRMRLVETTVRMKRLGADELAAYLDSGEWADKAGAYAIQGRAGAFIPWISGSFTGVVGLPLAETAGLLRAAGVPVGALRLDASGAGHMPGGDGVA